MSLSGDGAFAIWRLNKDHESISLELLEVLRAGRTQPTDARRFVGARPVALRDAPSIAAAIASGRTVMTHLPVEEWCAGLGSTDEAVRGIFANPHPTTLLVSLRDGGTDVGILGIAGENLPLNALSLLAPIGAMHLMCLDLKAQLTELMTARRSDINVQALEDLIQPLTAALARIEVVLELIACGERDELTQQIQLLRQSGERLLHELTTSPVVRIVAGEHARMERCSRATSQLLAATA